MSLNTAKYLAALRGLTAKFNNRALAATPFFPLLCTLMKSTGADEQYGILGNMPAVREWLGERVAEELKAADFVLKNKHYEATTRIKKTDLDDDRVNLYGTVLEEMADEASYHPDELLFTAVQEGETKPCFDGQYFFDTDHSWGESGTQSNLLTYNAADHTNVTVAEFKAALDQAISAMVSFKRPNGKPFIRPTLQRLTGLHAVVPRQLHKVAVEAVKAVILSNSSNVVIHDVEIHLCTHYTSAVKWHLFKTDGVLKPFVFQARQALRRYNKGLDDPMEQDILFGCDARYNVGYLAWWYGIQTEIN